VRGRLQLIVGGVLVLVGAVLVMSPTLVANTLGKPHDTPTR
jgi:hypothetical protein